MGNTQNAASTTSALSEFKPQNISLTRFSAPLTGNILWSYTEETGRIHDLYEMAKRKSWNVRNDIPWNDCCRNSSFPTIAASDLLAGFPEYEALPLATRREICWLGHGIEISEILHGEQGALLVSSQLVSCMPTLEAKLFASSQVFDEARHVEFFSRYLNDIVGEIHPPGIELKRLIEVMVNDDRWDMKFIACQIVIESLAMAKFQELRRSTLVPVLAFALDYIARDEARHVNFGAEFLKEHLTNLSDAAVEERSCFVLDSVMSLANSMNIYTRIAERYQWDVAALRLHLRQYRIKNPDIKRDRFRQLLINLKAVGLLTESARLRLVESDIV